PHSHPPGEFRHPWLYPPPPPSVPDELSLTTAGPHPAAAPPSDRFRGTETYRRIRDRLEEATTPDAADIVGRDITPRNHLGDAVGFSEHMIWLISRDSSA